MTRVVVSLTTIPPRFAGLSDCLSSLLNQTAHVDEINLFLPMTYRRFPGTWADPVVPPGISIKHTTRDFGPATKVLPAVTEFAGTDTIILFCDDDKIYDPNWAEHLISKAKAHPNHCVTAVGAKVSQFSGYTWESPKSPSAAFVKKDMVYRMKRALTFGTWKPPAIQGPGFVDILCGWGGCAVRPEFFTKFDLEIPEILWTVDDVWLSGCLERNGVPIWLEDLDSAVRPKAGTNDVKADALRYMTYRGHNRRQANQACIQYFREHFGIWGGNEVQEIKSSALSAAARQS